MNKIPSYNVSYIVNYPPAGSDRIGCRRHCSYCNWNKLNSQTGFTESLPDSNLGKSYYTVARSDGTVYGHKVITISGGGDPLFDVHPDKIPNHTAKLIDDSILQGYSVRIITREIGKAFCIMMNHKFRDRIGFSFSIDHLLIKELEEEFLYSTRKELFKRITSATLDPDHRRDSYEFSIVADTVPTAYSLQEKLNEFFTFLGGQILPPKSVIITIRENLRSIGRLRNHPGMGQEILKRIKRPECVKLRWLPARICLNDNLYLIQPMKLFDNKSFIFGTDMLIDFSELFGYCNAFDAVIYGSAARSFALWEYSIRHPNVRPQRPDLYSFSDFDIFVPNNRIEELLSLLTGNNHFRFKIHEDRIMESAIWMRKTILYRNIDPSFKISIYTVIDINKAKTIISEAGLGIDRVYVEHLTVKTFSGFKMKDLVRGIGRILPHRYKYLFKKKRDEAQLQHNTKLCKKGCRIIPLPWYLKPIQWLYDKL